MTITERAAPALPADDTLPLRWTAFIFRLPGTNGRARTALWRMLNHFDALKLGQGTWAIPHQHGHQPDLERAFHHIHGAGGEAWAREIGDADDDDLRLQLRLLAACERLWDGFFNDADRVANLADTDPDAAAEQLTELRDTFSKLLARDLVLSTAARRAEHRLDDLAATIATAGPGPGPDAAGRSAGDERRTPGRGARRHTVGTTNVVELTGPRVRAVLRLLPSETATWERAFVEFERFAYAPDPQRAPLRHNTFTVVTEPGRVETEQAAIRERIARFEAYLGT